MPRSWGVLWRMCEEFLMKTFMDKLAEEIDQMNWIDWVVLILLLVIVVKTWR